MRVGDADTLRPRPNRTRWGGGGGGLGGVGRGWAGAREVEEGAGGGEPVFGEEGVEGARWVVRGSWGWEGSIPGELMGTYVQPSGWGSQ